MRATDFLSAALETTVLAMRVVVGLTHAPSGDQNGIWESSVPGSGCAASSLSGDLAVYVDEKVFRVSSGEFMFLPRGVPHAFLLESDEVHQLALVSPGGFFDAVNRMNSPAERLEVPTDADTITHANADLTQTIEVFERYGLRFLTAEEISTTMPEYPMRTPVAAR